MATLDIFKTTPDAFSTRTLTDAVLKLPYPPGRVRSLGLFEPRSVATTTIMIEEKDGVLSLIPETPRGGAATQYVANKRTARPFRLIHLAHEHTMVADEVQNVRAWGSETEAEQVQSVLMMRGQEMAASMGVTEEHLMLGALRGDILDADGTTSITNLFTEFGVTQETEVAFNLSAATAAELRSDINGIVRTMQDNLGGTMIAGGIHAFCSSTFFDDLVNHSAVQSSYDRYVGLHALAGQTQGFQRESHVRQAPFHWNGIDWEEYRGSVGGVDFIPADKAIFFPKGVPGLYRIYFGPADFAETVNTPGLPRYMKQAVDQELNRWVKLHMQSNPLPLCLRPKVLMIGRRGA